MVMKRITTLTSGKSAASLSVADSARDTSGAQKKIGDEVIGATRNLLGAIDRGSWSEFVAANDPDLITVMPGSQQQTVKVGLLMYVLYCISCFLSNGSVLA